MKLLIQLFLISTLWANLSYAQCTAEVKDIELDQQRGSIVVQTEYKLNGQVVQLGETRYLDSSGTENEIIALVKKDIEEHCENIILRIDANVDKINKEILESEKASSIQIMNAIKDDLIGYTISQSEVNFQYKGKIITVKAKK